jgi:hypothetical protein
MTEQLSKQQWAKLGAYLSAGTGRQMSLEQINVYYDALNDLNYEVLQKACRRAIQEADQNFLPSVGAIRKYAAECTSGLLPQASEEWESVRKAIRRFGYMNKAAGLESLSPLARQAAMSVGWDTMCDSENISIQAAQFRMAYEAASKREADQRRLSPELRPLIESRAPSALRIANNTGPRDIVKRLADKFGLPGDDAA